MIIFHLLEKLHTDHHFMNLQVNTNDQACIHDVIGTPLGYIKYVFGIPLVNNHRCCTNENCDDFSNLGIRETICAYSACIMLIFGLHYVCIQFVFLLMGILSVVAIRK